MALDCDGNSLQFCRGHYLGHCAEHGHCRQCYGPAGAENLFKIRMDSKELALKGGRL